MGNPNHVLFLALNASAEPSAAVVLFATLCAKYLVLLVPLHLALLWWAGNRTTRFVALSAGLALLIALLGSGLIGLLVHSPRPFVIGLGTTLLDHRPSAAFPSNHALICFTDAAVLLVFGRLGLAAAMAGIGVLVAWSRIYLGVHFPLDMAGAAILAWLAAFVATHAMMRWGEALLALAEGSQARLVLLAGRRFRAG